MCIIIDNCRGVKLKDYMIDNSIEINKHGYAFYNLETKELTKTMKKEEMRELLSQKVKFLAHCRAATVGSICESNIHFFEEGDWIIAMNGTVHGLADSVTCDTKTVIKMLKHVKPKNIGKFLEFFEARFLLYNRKTGKKIRTGSWIKSHNIHFSKPNVLEEKTFINRHKWKHTNYSGHNHNVIKSNHTAGHGNVNPYGDYSHQTNIGYHTNSPSKVSKVINQKSKKKSDTTYFTYENGSWVEKQLPSLEKKEVTTHNIAVYDNLKKGRTFHHMLGEDAKLLLTGRTNAKYEMVLDGNEPYVLSGVSHKGTQVPVEVYQVSDKVHKQICKNNASMYFKTTQFIVPDTNNHIDGIFATMFFYPKERAATAFDNPTYITEF